MVGCLSLDLADDFCNGQGGGVIAHTPTRHAEGLGKTVDDDGPLLHAIDRADAGEFPFVNKILVDFVRNAVDVVLDNDACQGFQLATAIDGSRGIAGVVHENGLGLGRTSLLQLFCSYLKAVFPCTLHKHGYTTQPFHQFGVGDPIRCRYDNFITGIDQCRQRIEHGMLGPAGNGNLVRHKVQAVFFQKLFTNLFPQFQNSHGSGIAGFALVNGTFCRLANGSRCREVGFSSPQAYNVLAFSNQFLG